ncbi:MAG: hypothetical protein KAS23_07575 [Anaerohalosphaera sp.]|nr:hypothetical protein [Anaerohalosphaera sp.]
MVFRFYSNQVQKASNSIAAGIFIVGMLLIGFGVLIYLLPDFFATLAAIVFFMIGLSIIGYAIRLFVATRKMSDLSSNNSDYRENVDIHTPGNHLD